MASCAQAPLKAGAGKDLVSVNAALNQAQASYLKGCVDAFGELKMPKAFNSCRENSIMHRRELDYIMDQDSK